MESVEGAMQGALATTMLETLAHGQGGAGGKQERRLGCFLCAYSDQVCDTPYVEGELLRIEERAVKGRWPLALLATGHGATVAVILPEHAQGFVRLVGALPEERRRTLRVRIYHLLRVGERPAEDAGVEEEAAGRRAAGRETLRATAASAVVLEPDLLLNITDINNAEYCARQYPLRRLTPSAPTGATLRGAIIHSAFKEMLKSGAVEQVGEHVTRALRAQLTDLALRQISREEMATEAEPHMSALAAWYRNERQTLWSDAPQVRAETFLLAPEVGLKGRLDFFMEDERGGALLEVKTGGARADLPKREHRWQVYGYQTLLAARRPHDRQRPGATLLYSGTPGRAEGYGVPFALRELHRVLELRNQLALIHSTGVAPSPPGAAKCARCYIKRECLQASPLLGWEAPVSDERPEPVMAGDAAFFRKYYELLRVEALTVEQQGRALWRSTPRMRCEEGTALGDLQQLGEPQVTESGEWEYSFRCVNQSELREGDAILLSDGDPVTGAVVTGSILRLDERGVVVWTPERIAEPRLIDRYDSDITHTRTVRNLWRWLAAEPRLRAVVAGEAEPRFGPEPALDDLPLTVNAEQRRAIARALAAEDVALIQGPPGTGKTQVVAEIARRAMARGERVLLAAFTNQAVDNALLRMAVEGVTNFVRLGHELAVKPELRGYRLAERARRLAVDEPSLAPGDGADAALDPALLREALRRAPLVATTTATWSAERYDETGEPLRFDLAIVDEASQLTVPAALGALRFARRFVLVGDERQLPPLVVSEEAAAQGLGRSLFVDLLERWGERASVALRRQYRMHPAICGFPSAAFYGGALVAEGAAREALLQVTLDVDDPLTMVLAPERPMVFVDAPEPLWADAQTHPDGDYVGGAPGQAATRAAKASQRQATIVRRLVLALRAGGVAAEAMGAIAPYRAQVAAIRQQLAARGEHDVAVDTVDRFQGGERQVVFFSFGGQAAMTGHRGAAQAAHAFLGDPHRLNVALTRAQRKLIVVGDRRWLEREPLLRELIAYCAGLYGGRGGVITAR